MGVSMTPRLNLLLARTAEQGGATLRTRCRVVGFERTADGRLNAAISETATGMQERWTAGVIVNATGIQADSLRQLADPQAAPRMLTSRGCHLVLEQNLCPGGLGLLVPSTADAMRAVHAALPRPNPGGDHRRPPRDRCGHHPHRRGGDLLAGVRPPMVPRLIRSHRDQPLAGGRPLLRPAGDSLDSSRFVREHEVEQLPCGLVSVMGGKWTTCRPMAYDTLQAIARQQGRPLPRPNPSHCWGAERPGNASAAQGAGHPAGGSAAGRAPKGSADRPPAEQPWPEGPAFDLWHRSGSARTAESA